MFVIEKLKKLGLTSYEAQAYIALLELGNAEANEIAVQAKIPVGRIYNVLSNLEECRLIRSQESRPRRFVCVGPGAAMERLLTNKKKELKHAHEELETLASDLETRLSGVISREPKKKFWTVAIGDKSQELVKEFIMGAQDEILFFMASRTISERIKNKLKVEKYPEIINAIHDALEKGIDVKVILNKNVDFSMIEETLAIKRLLNYIGHEFNCRFAAIPATPFHIIDRKNVLLQMLNPMDPKELFAVVNIYDPKLAEELRMKFFAIWDVAEPYLEKR